MSHQQPTEWHMGVTNVTKDLEGDILWKGICVGHSDLGAEDQDKEHEYTLRVAARCERLESLGLQPTFERMINHERYDATDAHDPWIPLLESTIYDMPRVDGKLYVILHLNASQSPSAALSINAYGEVEITYKNYSSDGCFPAETLRRELEATGNCEYLDLNTPFVNQIKWLKEAGFTSEKVTSALKKIESTYLYSVLEPDSNHISNGKVESFMLTFSEDCVPVINEALGAGIEYKHTNSGQCEVNLLLTDAQVETLRIYPDIKIEVLGMPEMSAARPPETVNNASRCEM